MQDTNTMDTGFLQANETHGTMSGFSYVQPSMQTVYMALDMRSPAEPLGIYAALFTAQQKCQDDRTRKDIGYYSRDRLAWIEYEGVWRLCVGRDCAQVEGEPRDDGIDWRETPYRVRVWVVS